MKKADLTVSLSDCPDIMSVSAVRGLLQIGRTGVYRLLGSGEIQSFKIGHTYKIPKKSVVSYINKKCGVEGGDSHDRQFAD